MNNVRKILFPTDFSEAAQNAFRYCLVLADKLQASIQLLHVVYPDYEVIDVPVMVAAATKQQLEAAKATMKTFVDYGLTQLQWTQALGHVPVIISAVEIGNPVGTICQVAQREDADLIVMGTKGSHNTLERTFGSVTTGVVTRANIDVWVVPEKARFTGIEALAYATNLDEADPAFVMDIGKLFDPFCKKIHCVHVNVTQSLEKLLDLANLEAVFNNNKLQISIQCHQVPGDTVAEGLEDFVSKHKIDVLVMYGPHHDLLDRIFHRSMTRKMALETEVPLLVIKEKS